jgi:hypothetical protein
MTITIRAARPEDAEAIANIHNQGIVDRVATLETALRTPAGTREWLVDRSSRHPVIVAIAQTGARTREITDESRNELTDETANGTTIVRSTPSRASASTARWASSMANGSTWS